jgi:23S rRNA (uracil1939-C5)-methyltransferase
VTEVRIQRIAAGGDGVGRAEDGITMFVPRTAPGDRVVVEVVERRKRYARALTSRLVERAMGRVEPACRHYVEDACGGCQLQHLDETGQLAAKGAMVGDALRRIGGRRVEDPDVVPSPHAWRYRTRVTLSSAGGKIGFHRFDRPGSVFDLGDCLIARESVMALWARLRTHRKLLPERVDSVGLREGPDGTEHVIVATPDARSWDASSLARELGDHPPSLWWVPAGGSPRVVAGPDSGYPALAFEQVHPGFGDRIRADAVESLGIVDGRTVWDLFGGVGETARALADLGATVWSVDADRRAVAWGEAHEQERGAVNRVAGLVERVLSRLPEPDAVVANPPRAGMAKSVSAALDRWAAGRSGARVAYVSCDPATLARDLKRMPHLELRSVTAYDLFPQTSHVETLAVLEAE